MAMRDEHTADIQPVYARLTPLFEAHWAYEAFSRLMPFGEDAEGQAYAFSGSEPAWVEGDALRGSLRMVQYPRWRSDRTLLPDAHCLFETDAGEQVIARAAGIALVVPEAPGDRALSHWMRFWTDSPRLAWLNATLAFGVGGFTDERARVRYFAATPAAEPDSLPADAPDLELLGTARWEHLERASARPFGDGEGAGFATSAGQVTGGQLAGTWRGWHYPRYLRDGVSQLDAHAEIRGAGNSVILNRHGGLATRPSDPASGALADIVQHATFVAESPELIRINDMLALGVGFEREPGVITLSYYGIRVR